MLRPYRVLGIFLLVAASLLAAATPAAAASATGKNFTLPALTKTTYSISGTVRASSNLVGVANVSVVATSTTGSGPFTTGTATTSAAGTYTIGHLLPGSYTIRFDPSSATNLQHGYRGATAPAYFGSWTPATVKITTASLTGIGIRLPAGFKISGKVTRSNGTTAIPNVYVDGESIHEGTAAITDSAGNYTLMGLSPGTYFVNFSHDATASNQTGCWDTAVASRFSASCAVDSGVVVTSANLVGISPKIPNSISITGFVKTRASAPLPIAGEPVYAQGWAGGSAVTDSTGKYTIHGLNAGSYKILLDGQNGAPAPNGYYNAAGPYFWNAATASASSVVISAALTTLPIIKPPTGYFIKGKIANTLGTALASAFVDAVGGTGTAADGPGMWTDTSGNYSIGPLPPGNTYKINVWPFYSPDPSLQTGWYRNGPPNNFTATSSLAKLLNSNSTGINMRLPKGASISGTVKLTGGGACSNCSMYAVDSAGSVAGFGTTSSSGAYQIPGLSPGSYKVRVLTDSSIIDATHVRIVTSGFYKSGAAPNFSTTLAGATAIAVS